jgi:hypothetical protein
MRALNTNITTYGGGGCGHNPWDWMIWLEREPQGAIVMFWGGMRIGAGTRIWRSFQACARGSRNEDNLSKSQRERVTTLQMIEAVVKNANSLARGITTAGKRTGS